MLAYIGMRCVNVVRVPMISCYYCCRFTDENLGWFYLQNIYLWVEGYQCVWSMLSRKVRYTLAWVFGISHSFYLLTFFVDIILSAERSKMFLLLQLAGRKELCVSTFHKFGFWSIDNEICKELQFWVLQLATLWNGQKLYPCMDKISVVKYYKSGYLSHAAFSKLFYIDV